MTGFFCRYSIISATVRAMPATFSARRTEPDRTCWLILWETPATERRTSLLTPSSWLVSPKSSNWSKGIGDLDELVAEALAGSRYLAR